MKASRVLCLLLTCACWAAAAGANQVVVSTLVVSVPELSSAAIGIRLAQAPPSTVTVTIARTAGDPDLSVRPATLSFTAANWSVVQTTRIYAAGDADAIDGHATFTASAPGCTSAVITATEADRNQRFILDRSSVNVPEGGMGTFALRLAGQPAGNVTVSCALSRPSTNLAVVTSSRTFTPSNWSTAQTFSLSAPSDANAIPESATVFCSAPGWVSSSLTARVIDDEQRIVVETTTVGVPEGGNGQYRVRLGGRPAGNVTIYVMRLSGDSDINPNVASFTITPDTWSTARVLTLLGREDADTVDGQAVIRAHAAGWQPGYLTATERDNDRVILGSTTALTLNEGGSVAFRVRLAGPPAADVTVTALRNGDTTMSVTPASLTFTPSNYRVEQTFVLRAAEDANTVDGLARITASAPGWRPATALVTVVDNDRRLSASVGSLNVAEGGSSTFKLRLNSAPRADITVTCAWLGNVDVIISRQAGSPNLTVAPGTLIFTPANWNTPQTVTVSAAEDSDTANLATGVRCSATGYPDIELPVTKVDND